MTRRSPQSWRLHALGALGASLLALTTAPLPVSADGAANSTSVDPAIERVATADVPRVALTAGGTGAITVGVGEPIVVTLQLGEGIVGFDGQIGFDGTAIEYGGAAATSAGTALVANADVKNQVSLATFVDTGERPTTAFVEVRLITRRAGQIVVDFQTFDAVDADGVVRTDLPALSATVDVGGDATVITAPDAGPDPVDDAGASAKVTAVGVDVTGNGVVDDTDVTEVLIAWDELAASGDPCNTDTERMQTADVNNDGCVGVEDLAAVARAATPQAAASEPTGQLAVVGAFVVDVTHDGGDNQLNDDQCISAFGGCSLRAAIQQANATPGPNLIEFDIPGNGPHTITVDDKLPSLNDLTGGTTIDGYSEPGASANDHVYESNANIQIIVRPNQVVNGRVLMTITSSDNEVRGLSLLYQYSKLTIRGSLAARNKIVGNFIGTDPTGSASGGYVGMFIIDGANHNVVGTPNLADRNVVTGNSNFGMRIEQNDTDHNLIQNNIFGLTPDGSDDRPQGGGIDIQFGAEYNVIGGTAAFEHNVFSGLDSAGVDFSHNTFNNHAIGNYFGTDLTGTTGYGYTENYRGIWIKDDARLNTFRDNIVVNSDTHGLYNKHNYTGGNNYFNNRFGVTLDGRPFGNDEHGMYLRGHDDVVVGNVFANNGGDGIFLDSNNDGGANDDEVTERNRLSQNSFYDNGGLAIDITPNGFNNNDAGDGDTGTQGQLNHPEFTSLTVGQLTGSACAGCEVEVYLADDGEGRQYLGTAVADGGGSFTYVDELLTASTEVTALSIDTQMNTSEFAPALLVGGGSVAWTELTGSFYQASLGGTPLAYTSDNGSINNQGADGTTSFVNFDVVAPTAGNYTLEAQTYAPSGGSDSFWVNIDNAPGNGFLWDVARSSSLTTDLVNDRNNADPVVVTLTAGTHRIGVALREDGTGIATMALRAVGGGGGTTPPAITNPGGQVDDRNLSTSLQLTATPADATFWALKLPDGLVLDGRTGLISGTPTRSGIFPVTVWAANFAGTAATTFDWAISTEQLPPTINPIADQTSTHGDNVALQALATDPNDDTIAYSAIDLPNGITIDPVSGLISGTVDYSGLNTTTLSVSVTASDAFGSDTTSFMWTLEPGFSCATDATHLAWTDAGAPTYYVRLQLGGTDSYVGSTTATTMALPSQYGTYEVIYYVGGRQSTTCLAPGGPTAPSFDCSVTANVLSWTDQNVATYYIRFALNGEPSTYLGSSTTLSFAAPAQYGTYTVIANTSTGQRTTDCDAPGGPNAPSFDCSASATTLTWNDQNVATYYIRYSIDGSDVYLGSTSTLSYEIPHQYGVYTVVAYTATGRRTTSCDAPGGPVAP